MSLWLQSLLVQVHTMRLQRLLRHTDFCHKVLCQRCGERCQLQRVPKQNRRIHALQPLRFAMSSASPPALVYVTRDCKYLLHNYEAPLPSSNVWNVSSAGYPD